ncbi:toluene hydroxylase [Mycobacterium kansasii]
MSTDAQEMRPLKTWSHLAKNRRRPTEYEVVSTNLLWTRENPEAPFSLSPGIATSKWLVNYRENTALVHPDWDAFRDPDQLVYRTYNTIQDGQEAYVDGLLDEHSRNDHDDALSADWLEQLAIRYTPGRYLIHALQMSSAYLVAMAPSSTVANCFMFQTADQLRWVSRIAYRTAELRNGFPEMGFGNTERRYWETAPHWRPFVTLVEKCLTTWDFSEQFYALNIIVKPAVEAAFLREFGNYGRQEGDALTGLLAEAQCIDGERTRRWTRALVEFVGNAPDVGEANIELMNKWAAEWAPLAQDAISGFFEGLPNSSTNVESAMREVQSYRSSLGLQ